jgi:hypothetical protein
VKVVLVFSFFVTSIFGLQAITYRELPAITYQEWKAQAEKRFIATTDIEKERSLRGVIDYSLGVLKIEPNNTWRTREALYAYNFLREMMKVPVVHAIEEIDTRWLDTESYQLWKTKQQESWKQDKLTFPARARGLLSGLETNLTSLGKSPQDAYFQTQALYNYNLLRELLGKAPAVSLPELDHQWAEEVKESINSYVVMEEQGAKEATAAHNLLLDEAQRMLGFKQKIIALSRSIASGSALTRAQISYVILCEIPDLDAQLFTLHHELGHIVHNDTINSDKAKAGEITYDELLADKDFIAAIDHIDRYTTIGKQAFTNETKVGKHINEILETHKTFWIEPAADKLKELLFRRGIEKRADLYALDNLFAQNQISPILQEIVDYGESNYIVIKGDEDVHPSHIERALYDAGFLVDKGLDINKLLKDWYTTGKCKLAGGLPSLEFIEKLFPGIGATQGARDAEKAYALWLGEEKKKSNPI